MYSTFTITIYHLLNHDVFAYPYPLTYDISHTREGISSRGNLTYLRRFRSGEYQLSVNTLLDAIYLLDLN